MRYDFDWDPKKAKANARKHQVSFERATTIFRDPNLLSIPDEGHSESEERWITIGLDENGILIVLVHTFEKILASSARIRIISARKATKKETKNYEEGI
ncbi:MAG: BrnT family toxin [Acidobacteria bacterium]|nr:BrnT family toxin [Acidobacteriota bacterium]